MSRIIVIHGSDYVAGVARCGARIETGTGRTRMCGRKVRYIVPISMVFRYFNSANRSMACHIHGEWVKVNEEQFDVVARFELSGAELVKIK